MAIQSSLTCLITNLSIEPYHTRWSWPGLTATGYPLVGVDREALAAGGVFPVETVEEVKSAYMLVQGVGWAVPTTTARGWWAQPPQRLLQRPPMGRGETIDQSFRLSERGSL